MLEERCPGAKLIGRAILDKHWLVFDGFSTAWGGALANIVPSRQDEVWGVVYEITEEHLAKLDQFEGCPRYYQRRQVEVLRPGQKETILAWVYYRPGLAAGVPSRKYLETIINGARECGLPGDYINTVIDIFHTHHDEG